MFVRTKKTPNSNKTAVQLVESIRDGKRVRQRIIRHLGYAQTKEGIDALTRLALRCKEELLQKSRGLYLFGGEDRLSSEAEGEYKRRAKEESEELNVNLKEIREEKRIVVGVEEAYGKIFDEIGFSRVMSNPQRRKASVRLLKKVVMARILEPRSKLGTVELLRITGGIRVDVNAVYRMMDFIDERGIERCQILAKDYVCGLFSEPINVIFYDCTTLYFECFREDELRQNGYSKDGKVREVQIIFGLLVTREGLPIGYEIYEGSRFEGNTLEEALLRIRGRYKIEKSVFVADAAMLSKKNIEKMQRESREFVVGGRLKNLPKGVKEEIIDRSGYEVLSGREKVEEGDNVLYKEIELRDGLRLIVTYSERRAARDRKERERAIEKLKRRLKEGSNIKGIISNYGYKKFIKVEGEGRIVYNEEKIKEEERWDGLKGIITNVKGEGVETILRHYGGLWQIEETFRISKDDLRIRPIFHWTPRRIRSHIAICFMALVCARVMEYRVRLQYKKMSNRAIRSALCSLQISILKDERTKKRYGLPTKPTQEAKKIYQILGLKWEERPYQIEEKGVGYRRC